MKKYGTFQRIFFFFSGIVFSFGIAEAVELKISSDLPAMDKSLPKRTLTIGAGARDKLFFESGGLLPVNDAVAHGELWAEATPKKKWNFKPKGKPKWGMPKKMMSGAGFLETAEMKETLQKAEANYGIYCSACHGANGDGKGAIAADDLETEPRDHTDADIMSERTDKDIFMVISKGGDSLRLSNSMPPHTGLISEKEMRGLVKYIRKLCQCKYIE